MAAALAAKRQAGPVFNCSLLHVLATVEAGEKLLVSLGTHLCVVPENTSNKQHLVHRG